jgi:hypothetical protein
MYTAKSKPKPKPKKTCVTCYAGFGLGLVSKHGTDWPDQRFLKSQTFCLV